MPRAAIRIGSRFTWYCLTNPPSENTMDVSTTAATITKTLNGKAAPTPIGAISVVTRHELVLVILGLGELAWVHTRRDRAKGRASWFAIIEGRRPPNCLNPEVYSA